MVLLQLGWSHLALKQYNAHEQVIQQALAIYENSEEEQALNEARFSKAVAAFQRGDIDTAEEHARDALRGPMNDRIKLHWRGLLAPILSEQGKLEEAWEILQDIDRAFVRTGPINRRVAVHIELAILRAKQGQITAAKAFQQRALSLAEEGETPETIAYVHALAGILDVLDDDSTRAHQQLNTARITATDEKSRMLVLLSEYVLHDRAGEPAAAAASLQALKEMPYRFDSRIRQLIRLLNLSSLIDQSG